MKSFKVIAKTAFYNISEMDFKILLNLFKVDIKIIADALNQLRSFRTNLMKIFDQNEKQEEKVINKI